MKILAVKQSLYFILLFFIQGLCFSAFAQEQADEASLFELPLEALMEIEVVSVTRSAGQDVFTSPAAIYVVTQEDIRRSGHTSLPEQLRMVPGLHVARVDGSRWAITSRGRNSRFARFMLVQQDGRTIYSPISSGVYWEMQNPMLEDLDRIEVLRGPGGSLWGANAVHGIINILTKEARDTQGWLLSGGVGDEERGFGSIRYGGQLGTETFYRIYGKHFQRDDTITRGADYTDDAGVVQGGFRIDSQAVAGQTLTLQGDYTQGRFGNSMSAIDLEQGKNPIYDYTHDWVNWNLLGRFKRSFSESSGMELQMYYDKNIFGKTSSHGVDLDSRAETDLFDLDFQNSFMLTQRHSIVWGLNYRSIHTHFRSTPKVVFNKESRTTRVISGFAQDVFSIVPDYLNLIIGTKIEKNDHSGWEVQPSARLAWIPAEQHMFWAAVSRAVSVPSVVQEDANIALTAVAPNVAVSIEGNRDIKSMEMTAFELGYRFKAGRRFSLDVAVFSNHYKDIAETIMTDKALPTLTWVNEDDGYSHGIEISSTWRPFDSWKIAAGYSWINLRQDGDNKDVEENVPEHQFQVRSYYDISRTLEFNSALYFYDRIPAEDIPSFFRLDLGLIWKPTGNLELSLWGQNLLDDKHPEYGTDPYVAVGSGETQRSVYGKVTWRY